MGASEAQIRANKANSLKSTGPKTVEGKERSRQNSYKHGMTGDGVVLPIEEAAEVERRFAVFREELQPSGLLGLTLIRRVATLSVRMERCAEAEMIAVADRASQAMFECEIPDEVDEAAATLFREDAARLAAVDASKEVILARRYEAAAERGFFRALKELRLVEKELKATHPDPRAELDQQELGSFLDQKNPAVEFDARHPEMTMPGFHDRPDPRFEAPQGGSRASVDVPISIGRGR